MRGHDIRRAMQRARQDSRVAQSSRVTEGPERRRHANDGGFTTASPSGLHDYRKQCEVLVNVTTRCYRRAALPHPRRDLRRTTALTALRVSRPTEALPRSSPGGNSGEMNRRRCDRRLPAPRIVKAIASEMLKCRALRSRGFRAPASWVIGR